MQKNKMKRVCMSGRFIDICSVKNDTIYQFKTFKTKRYNPTNNSYDIFRPDGKFISKLCLHNIFMTSTV